MLERIIKKTLTEETYEVFGLRKDDKRYEVGDVVNNSHQLFPDPQYDANWELAYNLVTEGIYKGFYDAGELNGACSIEVNENNIKEALENMYSYDGKYLYLIAGDKYEYGNDVGEVVIEGAKVVAILKQEDLEMKNN